MDQLAYAFAMDLRKYEELGGEMKDLSPKKVYSLIRKAEAYRKREVQLGVRSDRYETRI